MNDRESWKLVQQIQLYPLETQTGFFIRITNLLGDEEESYLEQNRLYQGDPLCLGIGYAFQGFFFWKHIFFPKVSCIISFRSWFHADVSGQGLEAGRWYCVSVGCLRGECFKRHALTSSASASNFLVNGLPRGYCHLVAQPFPRWPCFLRIVGSITHSVFKTGHFRNTDLF